MKEFIDEFENSQGTVADFNRIFINNNELKGFKCDTNVSIGEMETGERRAITVEGHATLYFSLLSPKKINVNSDAVKKYQSFKRKIKPENVKNLTVRMKLLDKIKTSNYIRITSLTEEFNVSKFRIYREFSKLVQEHLVRVQRKGKGFRILHGN